MYQLKNIWVGLGGEKIKQKIVAQSIFLSQKLNGVVAVSVIQMVAGN